MIIALANPTFVLALSAANKDFCYGGQNSRQATYNYNKLFLFNYFRRNTNNEPT